MVPWPGCEARAPPTYGLSVDDHVNVCAPGSATRPPCFNPETGRHDFGLGVQTGSVAPDFALAEVDAPDVVVHLRDLLKRKRQGVLLQFGAYT